MDEDVTSLLKEFVLRKTEERPLTLTARRIKRLARELAGEQIDTISARRLLDQILEEARDNRRIFIRTAKTGARTVTVAPSWLDSPYLDVE
ncbi:MAG: hypothetical protein ABWK01_08000 [Infirmifilum sp.]